MYLLFGVLTTLVGWAVYFAILWTWRAAFGLAPDDTTGKMYLAGYTVAQVVQWIAAVLFAFFTNRKWVLRTPTDRSPCPHSSAPSREAAWQPSFWITS
ncbi:MAG: GtrA family protein [Oscillospiraceae bacterium]|nr:MAG: GtrA family protein [Oscillospiraceae bacterium]